MKIELKHIVGYLPYALMLKDTKRKIALTTTGAYFNANKDESFKFKLLNGWGIIDSEECEPILRPLSDLTKEIEVNGEKFMPIEKLKIIIDEFRNANPEFVLVKCFGGFFFEWYTGNKIEIRRSVPMSFYEKLYEWHFDIHNLIENNLAIDINTL